MEARVSKQVHGAECKQASGAQQRISDFGFQNCTTQQSA
jgi:hypothetical protein